MDTDSQLKLSKIIRNGRIASLGTLRQGAPFVSMVLYTPAVDFSAFYIHISRLAHHTQDILQDPRVSLMIVEVDNQEADAQTLARLSILGHAVEIVADSDEYNQVKDGYLEKYPQAEPLFEFKDFAIFRIQPESARYVAGFARAFNLSASQLRKAAELAE
jgi:heme iron utilization protein